MHPEEGDGGRGGDVALAPVACCAGDYAADREAEDDRCGFHERGAELFDDYHSYEDAETETDEFWITPLLRQYDMEELG